MPPLAAAIAAYLSISVAMAYVVIAVAVVTLASVAYSAYMMATMQTPSNSSDAASRLQTLRSSVQPHRIVYGEVMTGGCLVYAQSHSVDPTTLETISGENVFISLVVCFAAHECEEIKEIWLNNKLSTDVSFRKYIAEIPEEGYYTGGDEVSPGTWIITKPLVPARTDSYVHITKYLGTLDQVADPFLISLPDEPSTVISKAAESGLDDLSVSGTFTAENMAVFEITLAATGAADTFTWTETKYQSDGTTTYIAGSGSVTITGGSQLIADGISITFAAVTGHSVGQKWEIRAYDGAPWAANCTLTNRCYAVVTLQNNNTVFPTGLPNVKALIRGNNQIYNPATLATEYTTNFNLCVRDYLTKPYGLNAPWADINDTYTISGANICDELITLADGTTQKRYPVNGSFLVDKTPTAIMNELLASAFGKLVWIQGQYRILPAAYQAPDMTFHGINPDIPGLTESDLRGSIKVRPKSSMKDKFNTVKGTYISKETWQPVDFPSVSNALYVSEDGVEIVKDIQLNYITDAATAQRIAKIILEKARQGISVDFPAKWSAFPLCPGATVPITISYLGWSQKIFEVIDWRMNPDGGVDLQLQEEAAECYAWNNGEETTVDLAQNTILPDPRYIQTPTGLSAGEELYISTGNIVKSRAILIWNKANAAQYEINYLPPNNTIWAPLPLTTDTTCTVGDTMPGAYSFRVRCMNYLGAWGDWATITATMLGKTAPPPPCSTFLINRQPDGTRQFTATITNPPLDLAGFRIRYILGTSGTYSAMTPLHTDLLTSFPYETNQLAAGTYTFAIVSEDTSGNVSTPLYIQSTLGDPRLAGVIVDKYPDRELWPDTKTNCYVDEFNRLVSRDQKTWADFATDSVTWAAWTSWARNPFLTIRYETATIDIGAVTSFTPLVTTVANGTVTNLMNTSTDNVTWSGWVAAAVVTARYIKIRSTNVVVSGLSIITSIVIYLNAKVEIEYLNDITTSALTGSYRIGVGNIRLPIKKTPVVIKNVTVTLQNVGAGWSWELIDKNTAIGPQIKIYNASNALADCVIDAEVKELL